MRAEATLVGASINQELIKGTCPVCGILKDFQWTLAWHNRPLHEAIVMKCRELGIAGATVFRGIEGYGVSTLLHKRHLLRSWDRPIMVSIIDTEEKSTTLLPALDEMVNEGLIRRPK